MKQATVIYDADCGFCRWSLAVLLRTARSGTLRPLPLGTPEADRILADLTVAEREASWHLGVDDERFSAGEALAPAMEFVPAGAVPEALFRRFPAATERGYRWVAEHRGLLGRPIGDRARRWADRVIAAQAGSPQ